jgi:hypothetical protein
MEKGYDNLIESIIPLLGDMEGIQRLKRWKNDDFYSVYMFFYCI